MPEFFQTIMGRTFYEGAVPRIAKALGRIASALEAQAKSPLEAVARELVEPVSLPENLPGLEERCLLAIRELYRERTAFRTTEHEWATQVMELTEWKEVASEMLLQAQWRPFPGKKGFRCFECQQKKTVHDNSQCALEVLLGPEYGAQKP